MNGISKAELYDSRGLIREAYRIEGIDAGQCRSVFLDWLLGAAETPALPEQIAHLLGQYGTAAPEHPMNVVLRDALSAEPQVKGRRGGWRGRAR